MFNALKSSAPVLINSLGQAFSKEFDIHPFHQQPNVKFYMLYYFSHSQMWNLTNPHKTFSSGFTIHILQPSSPKSQELRKKVIWVPVEEDLAQSWLIEALNRDQAKSESDPWLFRWVTSSPHFWLNYYGAVFKEIFMQFLKANCRQNLFCTSILDFFLLNILCFIIILLSQDWGSTKAQRSW